MPPASRSSGCGPALVVLHRTSDEEFVYALAEAMRVEYETIAAAGVTLQVDDAWLPALWDRIGMAMGLPGFLEYSAVRVEALNHALRNVPEERVRYHLCWGSWHGPHAFDLGFEKIVDLMLRVKAKAYLIEAANARHEHESRAPSSRPRRCFPSKKIAEGTRQGGTALAPLPVRAPIKGGGCDLCNIHERRLDEACSIGRCSCRCVFDERLGGG